MRNCPERGGGASLVLRNAGLDNGRVMSTGAEGASRAGAAIKRWEMFGQRGGVGPEESSVMVREQVPWGWDDGQGHP